MAKETFSKLLLEDGVEEAAKYVHIFGKMIIFELLTDHNLHRSLHELSEFYHKSDFKFTFKDEETLLITLKKKVLANEIKVLTGHTNNQFDFLGRLDPVQTYSLVKDETPQVQQSLLPIAGNFHPAEEELIRT